MTECGVPDAVLDVRHVSKLYARRSHISRHRLSSLLPQALLGRRPTPIGTLLEHEFWALNDISFSIPRGKACGIIGLNGSGKTTMLRILSGQILPDRGEVIVRGSSAALIDLTAGFQMAASGRDNIYLRAAALGWDRARIASAFDEIVAFSELGDAINAPVATYSAGMTMRLAFSVMSSVQPDLLLIDEVLAVGDFRFRQKCLARIQQIRETCGLVLVSHAMSDVSRFCDEVIYLEKGRIAFRGDPQTAIARYRNAELQLQSPTSPVKSSRARDEVQRNDLIDLLEGGFVDPNGKPQTEFDFGQAAFFRCRFRLKYDTKSLVVAVPVWTTDEQLLSGLTSESLSAPITAASGEVVTVSFDISNIGFNPGKYSVTLTVLDGVNYLIRKELGAFSVRASPGMTWGRFTPPYRCSIETDHSPI